MANRFSKMLLVLGLNVGLLSSVACTKFQGSNPDSSPSGSESATATAVAAAAAITPTELTGIWKLDAPTLNANKNDLKEMGDLRYEFKSGSRVRIYGRSGQRVEWVEKTYVYSPQLQMLIIDSPSEYNGTIQMELIPKDANTFAIKTIINGGTSREPSPVSVSQAVNLVRSNETVAFEKDIEAGASLSGKPLEKVTTAPMVSIEKLIGTWSFAAVEDEGYVSSFNADAGYPTLQIRLSADGTGSILSEEKSSAANVPFLFIVSPSSRRIFLFERRRAVFAVLTVSDFDDQRMTITKFDARYLKTTDGKEVYSGSSFVLGLPMTFAKISEADALDKKLPRGKSGIAQDYKSGVSLDKIQPLVVTLETVEPSPAITINFDRARPHCARLTDGSLKVEDQQIRTITEDGVQYEISDRILMNVSGEGRYSFKTGGNEFSGFVEVEKTVRQLNEKGQPISAEPQGHVSVSQNNLTVCSVQKNDGKFSRSRFTVNCYKPFEGKTSTGLSIKNVKIETTCEAKR